MGDKLPPVEETLSRLGVKEIEERVEISPLLFGGDVQDMDRGGVEQTDWTCCSCKFPKPEEPPLPDDPIPLPPPGGLDG